jgi:hypothetical protein
VYLSIKKYAIILIKGWRYIIRPFFPANACIFEPTCSRYTEDAIEEYGLFKGSAMGVWRILRCNPWNRGGYDPVKIKKEKVA